MFLMCGQIQLWPQMHESQLYQLLLGPQLDGDAEELQDFQEHLKVTKQEREALTSPILPLHAIQRSQGHNTMKIAAQIGTTWVIILVDLGNTYNFMDTKLVRKLCLPMEHQCKLKVTITNGCSLSTLMSRARIQTRDNCTQ